MFAKLEINGTIELKTGMHIGGSSQFAAIGAVDSPIVRDPFEDLPMIPGSSLKGKLRTLLAKKYNNGRPNNINLDKPEIKRLFGSTSNRFINQNNKNDGKTKLGRLIFSDSILSNAEEIKKMSIPLTEVKMENSINRLNGMATPRQIERSIRGSKFDFSIIYNAEVEEEIETDLKILKEGLELLEYDYLGGSGSRGYGRIEIIKLDVNTVIGKKDEKKEEKYKSIMKINKEKEGK